MAKWRRSKSLSRRWQKHHLVNKYGSTCWLCGKSIDRMADITIDHWIPLSKGGVDTLDNYRLAHDTCNMLKSDMLPDQFRDFQLGTIEYR